MARIVGRLNLHGIAGAIPVCQGRLGALALGLGLGLAQDGADERLRVRWHGLVFSHHAAPVRMCRANMANTSFALESCWSSASRKGSV